MNKNDPSYMWYEHRRAKVLPAKFVYSPLEILHISEKWAQNLSDALLRLEQANYRCSREKAKRQRAKA